MISAHVEQSAELMNMCLESAKGKFGERLEDEAIIRDLYQFHLMLLQIRSPLTPLKKGGTNGGFKVPVKQKRSIFWLPPY